MSKNENLDNVMNNLNDQVDSMITQNNVDSIFEVTEKYDQIIEAQSSGASDLTLSHLYQKCYEGIKTNAFSLFGNILQNQTHEKSLLENKLNFYQKNYN